MSHPTRFHKTTGYKKKENIPYEIKNAREWDPNKNLQDYSSSDESDDECWDDDEDADNPPTSVEQRLNEVTSATKDSDGFQTVMKKQPPKRPGPPFGKLLRPSGRPRPRPRINFNQKKDNLARAAFRKRQPPNGKFMLPKDCHEIEPNRSKMYDIMEEMGVRFGSFIRPPQHVHDRELQLWGTAAQVELTTNALKEWLIRSQEALIPRKSMTKDKFASEYSNKGTKYKSIQKKMEKEAATQRYQQIPEAGQTFDYTGSFIWPVDEVRPEDLLGSSLEALDPVRFQYSCYIIFDNQLSAFRIFTNYIDSVEKAFKRIEGIMKAYVARNNRPLLVNMVEPPGLSLIRKSIKVVTQPESDAGKGKLPVLTGGTLELDARNKWLEESVALRAQNGRRIEASFRRIIPNLPFYQGNVRIRVFFGDFALTTFRWPEGETSIPFEHFVTNMAMSGTKGQVLRDLGFKKDAKTIMTKIYKAIRLFQSLDNSSASLEDAAPSFGARFVFDHPAKPSIQLEVEMNNVSADEGLYEKNHAFWTKVGRDSTAPLDMHMIRLGGTTSWKIRISHERSIDNTRIEPRMDEFANSVKFKKSPKSRTELTGQKLFTWDQDRPWAMQPSSLEQKTALRYRLVRQTEWIFEIARYDTYRDPKNPDIPSTTSWGATMWNTDWDSTFTDNSGLGIGESANWTPKLETFFPKQSNKSTSQGVDPGIAAFLENVQSVAACLDDIKYEPPHLRK